MPATIKLGDTGDDVKRLQRVFARTKVLGPESVDGVFGPETDQAVRDLQQSKGLVLDGIVGPTTWSHLHPYREASPTLQAGSLGRWSPCSRACSRPDSATRAQSTASSALLPMAVVRQYQTNAGLPVTGAMDERTWMAPAGAAGATLESLSV